MKAATGELNLTVITIIAISLVIAFFYMFWPTIRQSVEDQFGNVNCTQRDASGKCINAGSTGGVSGDGLNTQYIITNNYIIDFSK